MYDLVCVGDTTLDTFLKVQDAAVHCDLKSKSCELCFKYGEKIAVDELRQNPGGNSANVAVGTATLGVKTALYAIIGDDDIGQNVKRMIGERKVDTKYLLTNKGKPTNYSTIISFKGERTILEMKYPAHLTFSTFPTTDWVYLSSLKQDPKSVYESLVRLKKKMGFKIAFNPGMFQLTHPSNDIVTFLPNVDVLIVNKEEAELLVRKVESLKSKVSLRKSNDRLRLTTLQATRLASTSDSESRRASYKLQARTRGLVFITDGPNGAYAFDGERMVHCNTFPAPNVVDRTGAGDAFSSGVVAGLTNEVSFPEVIRWGMANSAAVLKEIGPQNGLLNISEIRRILANVKIFPDLLKKSLQNS